VDTNICQYASVDEGQDAPPLEVPSVPKITACCHKTSHVSFGWAETYRHDHCMGQRGLRSDLARPRTSTEKEAAVSRVQARSTRHHTESRRQRRTCDCGHIYCDEQVLIVTCISRDRVVQLCPPAIPYIKKSFEGILTYELPGDYINKYYNYADPSIRIHDVTLFRNITSCKLISNNTTWR
jgi:hypothetical protein